MRIYRSAQFDVFLAGLAVSDSAARNEMDALSIFLERHRHGAQLPEVRWRIQQSSFVHLTGELRCEPPFAPYRVLFAMNREEDWLYYLVGGNKAQRPYLGNAWYDAWVPVADAFLEKFLDTPID